MAKTRIGIVGARSYTARELLAWLARHPAVEVTALMARVDAAEPLAASHPSLRGLFDLEVSPIDEARLAALCDVIFLCLPHGPAALCAKRLLASRKRVVDLSADFRFADATVYEKAYKQLHPAPELLAEAVYGLPELWRERIRAARVVGNPGCYPTSVLMALAALVKAFPGALPRSGIVADCKSGVSGAGRTLSERAHFVEANEGLSPYGVANHRHGPEIDTQLSAWAGAEMHVTFVPHLVPMDRGICATVHVPWQGRMPALEEIHGKVAAWAKDEPFVRVLPLGETVNTKAVAHSNFVDIAVAADVAANLLIVMTAIDNLVKGASGQAIQCMNLMLGCDETEGLK